MTNQAPDDIFALYSRFDLDERNYRVFSRPEPNSAHAPALAVEKATDLEMEQRRKPVDAAGEMPACDQKSQPTRASVLDNTRSDLQSLWRRVQPAREAHSVDPGSLSAGSITVCGMAGGVGTTTVSATLASLLAKSGRRCAIIDGAEDSTLPVFFRTQKMPEDRCRFIGLQSLFEPQIRIISSTALESALTSASGTRSLLNLSLVERTSEFDHLIFDRPPRSDGQTDAKLRVCVAIPDVSSLLGARKKAISELPDPAKTVYVLNRFNSEISLHQEILAWYRENCREVVTVLDSPLVSEALAEGTTVLDWAPESSVSTDFMHLFRIVSKLLLVSARERLPVCS